VAKIVVPTPNTVITSAWGKTVADALNVPMIQHGIANVTFTAGVGGVVTFPVAFDASKPVTVVVVCGVGATILIVPYPTVTPTQFQAHGFDANGAALNGGFPVWWIAAGGRT
jgi:hypothetical protein